MTCSDKDSLARDLVPSPHQVIRSSGHPVFLGIDAGGTQTRSIVAAGDGQAWPPQVVGDGHAGPANWTTLGPVQCAQAIAAAVGEALEVAGVPPHAVAGACVAMAGYYPPWHEPEARSVLAPLLPGISLRLVPDLIAAWAGALGGQPGIALVAGTGAVAYGRSATGAAGRSGGWGPLFGDEGGGYWIGCQALRAAARALDGRGPATALVEGLWLKVEGSDKDPPAIAGPSTRDLQPSIAEEALRAVYRDAWTRERVAALSAVVSRQAAAGDQVALEIQEQAAAELGALIYAVSRRLRWGSSPLPVAAVGGVLENWPGLRHAVERWLAAVLPNACWTPPLGSPVEGAVLLAQGGSGTHPQRDEGTTGSF
jgi:N-acetylglucosamine kinase-like BadF-type ATPase